MKIIMQGMAHASDPDSRTIRALWEFRKIEDEIRQKKAAA